MSTMDLTRKKWLIPTLLVLFAIFSASLFASDQESIEPYRPNILFIMMDDLGWADIGAFGNPDIHTPNIDQLATTGTKLTQYYSGAAVCSPTRFSLMTGRNPVEQAFTGIVKGATQGVTTGLLEGGPSTAVVLDETLPWMLRDAGYQTYHVGKWHINGWGRKETRPRTEDFGGVGFHKSARMQFSFADTTTHVDPEVFFNELREKPQTVPGLSSDVAVDIAMDFLDQHPWNEPFFMNLWLYAPHRPMDGASPFWLAFYGAEGACPFNSNCPNTSSWTLNEKKYAAMISYADEQIGLLLDYLENQNVLNDTLVIFTSDNGGDLGQEIHPNGNGPLKGGKFNMYEGGIRVPFIVWKHGASLTGHSNNSVVTSLDMIPTLASLLDLPLTSDQEAQFKGMDRSDTFFTNTFSPRQDTLIWTGLLNNQPAAAFGMEHRFAVREGDMKLVMDTEVSTDTPFVQLFDVAQDPYELNDLAINPTPAQSLILVDLWRKYWHNRSSWAFIDYEVEQSHVASHELQHGSVDIGSTGGLTLRHLSSFDYGTINELSFRLTIHRDTAASGEQTILEKPGNWRVYFQNNGDLMLSFFGRKPGNIWVWEHETLVQSPQGSVDLGVSFIRQQFKDNLEIRWYIDDQIDSSRINSEFEILNFEHEAHSPIYVGMSPGNTFPFDGHIQDLKLYTLNLTGQELMGNAPAIP